jgi:hypothetical protein
MVRVVKKYAVFYAVLAQRYEAIGNAGRTLGEILDTGGGNSQRQANSREKLKAEQPVQGLPAFRFWLSASSPLSSSSLSACGHQTVRFRTLWAGVVLVMC